jgi:hypothetical protein
MSPFSGIPQTENGTNGKRQLPVVRCKRKTETQTSVCLLQTELEKLEVCFPWKVNDKQYRRLLFQQTCTFMMNTT